MKYLSPSFSSPANSTKYIDNFDKVFNSTEDDQSEVTNVVEEVQADNQDPVEELTLDLANILDGFGGDVVLEVMNRIQPQLDNLYDRLTALERYVTNSRDDLK